MTSTTQNNKGIPLFLLFISMCEFSAIAQSCWHHISRGIISNHSILFIWQSWSFVKCDLVLLIHIGWHQIWIIFWWIDTVIYYLTKQINSLIYVRHNDVIDCHRWYATLFFLLHSLRSLANSRDWFLIDSMNFDSIRFFSCCLLLAIHFFDVSFRNRFKFLQLQRRLTRVSRVVSRDNNPPRHAI